MSPSSRNGIAALLPYTSDVEATSTFFFCWVAMFSRRSVHVHVRLDRVHRALDDQLDAHRGSQVKHRIGLIDQLLEERQIQHRVDDALERVELPQVRDVSKRPGRQVVDDGDSIAPRDQCIREVRSDEASAASN